MKKPQIMIAVVVILLLVIGGFLMMKKSPGSSMNKLTGTDSSMETISGTIEDLFAKNIPMECTFASVIEGQESSGTVMVANKKMRGEFTTNYNGKEETAAMIQDGEYMYSWSPSQKTGSKIKLSSIEDQVEQAKVEMTKDDTMSMANQQGDYSCKPWIAMPGSFTPPADVTFTDLTAMMESSQQMMKDISGAPAAPCAVCDQVPAGESRDACKAQLKC